MVSPSSVFEPTRPRPSCQSHITVTHHFFDTLADVLEILRTFGRLHTAFQIENIPAHHPQDEVVSSQDKRDLFSFLSFQMITDLFRNGYLTLASNDGMHRVLPRLKCTTKHFNRYAPGNGETNALPSRHHGLPRQTNGCSPQT